MKGILMKPEGITATAEGRKTVTRRVIKPQPDKGLSIACYTVNGKPIDWVLADEYGDPIDSKCPQPRYQVGETVYIKEKALYWVSPILEGVQYEKPSDWWSSCVYQDDPEIPKLLADNGRLALERSINQAVVGSPITGKWEWKSPLHMPEEAARYFILIKDVRAEILRLPLSPEELRLEGGEIALPILEKINGLWVFRYEFELKEKEKI